MFSDLRYRVRALFRKRSVESDLDEELRFHIEQEAEKLARAGCRARMRSAVRESRSAA